MAQEGEIDIQALQQDGLTEELRQELQQHCSYCRQWFPNDRYVKQHWSRVHKSQSQQYIAAAKHWRRMQFGPIKDTCSWCKGKPAARSDHRDTCPVLFQLSMVWVMQHDDASIQVRDEREIDLSLPDSSQLRKWELKCQICEVKVTARGLRKHMTQKHGELWQGVRPQVDKLCSAWSMGIQENICQFCNSSYGTRNVHAPSCHAITQTALARVRTLFESIASVNDHGPDGGTGGSADAGSVRGSQHRREAHADTAAGGGRRQEAAQAKRQRGTGQGMDGQKQKVPSQPRDIRAILRDRGGRHGGHDEAAMQGSGKAGGHAQHSETVNQLGDFCEDGVALHHPGAGSSISEVEGGNYKAEQFVGQCQPKDDTLLVPPKPTHGDLQELDSGPATEGQGCRVEHGSGPMGVSEMVAGQSGPRTGHGQSSTTDLHLDEDRGGPKSPDHVRDRDGFPLQASPDSQHARRHGGATTGRQLPQARGESVLREIGDAYGTGSSSARRASDSQRGLQEIRSSDEAGRAHAVRTLVLRNNANYCYVNTAVRTILWAVAVDPTLETTLTNIGRSLIRGLFTHKGRAFLVAGHILFSVKFLWDGGHLLSNMIARSS